MTSISRESLYPTTALPKARLATWGEHQGDRIAKFYQAPVTAWRGLLDGKGNDNAMARLDDTSRALGTAGIAALGSLGTPYRGGSLPLWLGGAAWLGSMAITPAVINGMIAAKTGVNLSTHYRASNGALRPLFQDPNYLPLQVIPFEKRVKLAEQLGIARNNPDRPALLQAKLKQIAVQGHTWWMLMAGMATPVLASVICDQLEDPLKGAITSLWPKYLGWKKLTPAIAAKDASGTSEALQRMAQSVVGSGSELTANARWWKKLPGELLGALGIDRLPQSTLLEASESKRFESLTKQIAHALQNPTSRDRLSQVLHRQGEALEGFLAPFEKQIQKATARKLVTPGVVESLRGATQQCRDVAQMTLTHFRELLTLQPTTKGAWQANVAEHLEKRTLPYLEHLMRTGQTEKAASLFGGAAMRDRIWSTFKGDQFAQAVSQSGANPKDLLMNAMRSLGLRRRWLRYFPALIGTGMLIATMVFVDRYVGRDFGPSSKGEANA